MKYYLTEKKHQLLKDLYAAQGWQFPSEDVVIIEPLTVEESLDD